MSVLELQAAQGHLHAAETEQGLASLLEAWRETPDPRLAELIDVVSARITRPPLPGKSQSAQHEAFMALVPAKDPADLPRMLALVGTTRAGLMVE